MVRPRSKRLNQNRSSQLNNLTDSGRNYCVSDEPISGPQVKILFEDMYDGSEAIKINPFNCVPYTKIRPVSRSGVRRLASIFDYSSDKNGSLLPGLVIGSDLPMVIELALSDLNYVRDFLKDQGMDEKEIEIRLSQQKVWYGIVDGNYCNHAIKLLMTSKQDWCNFQWTVLKLRSGYPLERYRQLARATNARHDKEFYVENTLFDELDNLKSEFDRLSLEQSKPTHTNVARAYFGCETVTRTMTLMSSAAIRLSADVIKTMGEIMYSEHPNLCLSHNEIDNRGATTEDTVLEKVDCRLFRKFVNLTSLRQSTIFMNPINEAGIRAQINTLHKAKQFCQLNSFKTVQHYTISSLHQTSLKANEEEKKILKFLGSDTWPADLHSVRENLFHTTILDKEIEANQGNEFNILPSLRSAIRRVNPKLLSDRDDFMKSLNEISSKTKDKKPLPETKNKSSKLVSSNQPQNPNAEKDPKTSNSKAQCSDKSNPLSNDNAKNPSSNLNNSKLKSETTNTKKSNNKHTPPKSKWLKAKTEKDIKKLDVQSDVLKLNEKELYCKQMTWQEYDSSNSSSQKILADAIITQPPGAPSRSFLRSVRNVKAKYNEISYAELNEFPGFCKRNLLPGGYVILVIPFYLFTEWYEAFYSAGFGVMEYPYVLTKDSKTVPVRATDKYPQCGNDYALIATNPGRHPQHFNPRFNASFQHIDCSNDCTLSTMFNIPQPRSKLTKPGTRIPFHTNELSVKMLRALMDLFSPHGAHIIDPYAGSMTTAMAALSTNRKCLSVERDELCFQTAVQRLRSLLPRSTLNRKVICEMDLDIQDNDLTDITNEVDCTMGQDSRMKPILLASRNSNSDTDMVLKEGHGDNLIDLPTAVSLEKSDEREPDILTRSLLKRTPESDAQSQQGKLKTSKLTLAQKLRLKSRPNNAD